MKKYINKAKLAYALLRKAGICREFSCPGIIVYDNCHPGIMDDLLGKWGYVELNPDKLYVSLMIVVRMVLKAGLIRKGLFYWNHACVILHARPKLVITLIDNTRAFQRLDKLLNSKIRFISIQNGNRFFNLPGMCEVVDKSLSKQEQTACLYRTYHSEFFCFGQFEMDLYRKLSATVDKFYPVGSLVNSIHMKSASKSREQYDLCLVSQYFPDKANSWREHFKGYALLCEWLAKYLQENPGLKLCIAARSMIDGRYSDEEMAWYSRYGLENYLYYREDRFSTYRLVDSSNVTLCAMSTVFFESLARGSKILLLNLTGYEIMTLPTLMPPDPLLYLYESTYDEFRERINLLMQMEIGEYSSITSAYAKYMMNNNPDLPTIEVIQDHISQTMQ